MGALGVPKCSQQMLLVEPMRLSRPQTSRSDEGRASTVWTQEAKYLGWGSLQTKAIDSDEFAKLHIQMIDVYHCLLSCPFNGRYYDTRLPRNRKMSNHTELYQVIPLFFPGETGSLRMQMHNNCKRKRPNSQYVRSGDVVRQVNEHFFRRRQLSVGSLLIFSFNWGTPYWSENFSRQKRISLLQLSCICGTMPNSLFSSQATGCRVSLAVRLIQFF